MFRKNSGIEKFQAKEGGSFTVLSKFFLSHRTEKTSPGNYLCFRKIPVGKNILWIRRGGWGYHDFPSKFLSQCTENFRKGILLFLRKTLVSKSFMDEKGGITFFRRKFLVSQCRKYLWASLQGFRKIGVSKEFMHNRGYHNFSSKIFCLTVSKNFV